MMQGEKSDEITEKVKESKQNAHRFDWVTQTMGIQKIDPNNLFVDISKRADYDLPKQGFHLDASNNSASALDELIYAIGTGNANWSNNLKMNGDILTFLTNIGIDIERDFDLNGVAFEVNNGIVQTKGYANPVEKSLGTSYLNGLLEKAYEEHLI